MKFTHFLTLTAAMLLANPLFADILVKDDTGQEVRLPAPARRIVSLAPHVTENLYAAGAGQQMVGAVDYSDYPPEAKKLPRIGSYARIDLEALAALKPDLVIAWETGNNAGQLDKLKRLGIAVFITQPNHMDDIAGELERFGQLAGTESTANAVASNFRKRLASLRSNHAGKAKVRVFYQIWKAPLMTVGGPQIITDAIKLCGGENVFGQLKPMAPTVSIEAVLEANPEAIVATGMGDAKPEWLDDWNQWKRLSAVKQGNLFHINPDIMQRHTPRILDGAEQLCRLLDVARGHRSKR